MISRTEFSFNFSTSKLTPSTTLEEEVSLDFKPTLSFEAEGAAIEGSILEEAVSMNQFHDSTFSPNGVGDVDGDIHEPSPLFTNLNLAIEQLPQSLKNILEERFRARFVRIIRLKP